ncbi:MAG: AgmX/PglI C-terminal domain-containing protein [Myxococcales bacterium]|nr:AgmX/PglI C-terminal domain-containing protein [Myxococcales bacterium]
MGRWSVLLAMMLAACDEPPLPPPPGEYDERAAAERVAQEEEPPPEDDDGALPVALPHVEPGAQRPLPAAALFVVLTASGESSVGTLATGLRPQGGTVVKVEQIAETLARLRGDQVGPGSGPIALRVVEGRDPVDAIALIDQAAPASGLVPVLQQVAQRRTAIAVTVRSRRARLAFVTGTGLLRGAPVHFEVTTSGVSLYGTAHAWGDVGAAVGEIVDTHKRASSMSVLADLAIAPATPTERVVMLLGMLAAAGISEAQLTVDTSLAPVRPPGVYVTRDGGVPRVTLGQPNSQGDLDKAIIRRYVKRNIQKIQYCYEKQLLASPELSGTVTTQFFIAPNGTVATAAASGVHPGVARCVADVIKRIEFPRPKGGGGVQVNYPFTFRPSGG